MIGCFIDPSEMSAGLGSALGCCVRPLEQHIALKNHVIVILMIASADDSSYILK